MLRNMRAERVRAGMTAAQAAKVIGVSTNALLKWERGDASPMASNLMKLCHLYSCSAEYLIGMTDDRTEAAVKQVGD
ncbi:helix-turn-helix domain-containing protein [Parafannyhessea umbonata]|uniref:helix-turn-helix domain-containing protein n=1 Tax=Parafannyhessea umbonata TaxID=604330 RepID=UPI00359C60FF